MQKSFKCMPIDIGGVLNNITGEIITLPTYGEPSIKQAGISTSHKGFSAASDIAKSERVSKPIKGLK